tara:strand:- start:96 stop:335 length:240 start_codon:yes stop_codon:yes gene_type:complete
MGEARRRSEKGLPPRFPKGEVDNSIKVLKFLPFTISQRDQFLSLTKTVSWIGIIILIVFWVVVRFIGPAAGWWVPADMK